MTVEVCSIGIPMDFSLSGRLLKEIEPAVYERCDQHLWNVYFVQKPHSSSKQNPMAHHCLVDQVGKQQTAKATNTENQEIAAVSK